MLKTDDKVFLRHPKESTPNKRVLCPGTVVGVENDRCVIRLDESCSGIQESTHVFLHFERRQKFLQQAGRLCSGSEDPLVLAIQLEGAPVSAESRECFRVSCLGSNIKATIGDEPRCEVVDISATGLAFYARLEYDLGRRVRVTFSYAGKEYVGHGTIQSARSMTPTLRRYGIHCTDSGQDTLAKSLASINVAVQGEQRRRMAGS